MSEPTIMAGFSTAQYLGGHCLWQDLAPVLKRNTMELLTQVNELVKTLPINLISELSVRSGYRPMDYNLKIGGAKNSAHITCEAIDIGDPSGKFHQWIKTQSKQYENGFINYAFLIKHGLYMEELSHSSTWVHLQTRIIKSGKREFIP